jgi:hypothetical protein
MSVKVKFNLLLLLNLKKRYNEVEKEIMDINNKNSFLICDESIIDNSEEILRKLMVLYLKINDKTAEQIIIIDSYFTRLSENSLITDLRYFDAFNNFYETGYRSPCFMHLYSLALAKQIDNIYKINKLNP